MVPSIRSTQTPPRDAVVLRSRVHIFLAALLATTSPAFAIPSPELVVGTLTSVSQLMALLSAIVGGGAVAAGSRLNRSGGGQASRTLGRVAAIAGLVAVASLIFNVYQFTSQRDARRSQLEATLIRPTPKAASGQALDPNLKEISYKDQQSHPLGLSTEEAEAIIKGIADGSKPDWIVLDIRESAEAEMGTFKNAERIRFPDLPSSRIDLSAKKALLICHNGNRSAETCAALAAKGIDCKFIKGGLEKWLVEGRVLDGFTARSVDELRTIPDYPNHQTLIETADVHALVAGHGAIFVDVRYPGEFAASHVPGAINLALRPTPTDEIKRRLAELPKKPVIAPCYDRRSCFFGEILGLELTRAGHDFRGRYTVPWEYFVAGPRPPHVEAWLAEANRSTWSKAGDWLAAKLGTVAEKTGLPLALLLLAALSRVIILPFSLKAERDQIAARRMEPQLAALKETLKCDSVRLTRAVRDLYRTHGLTPGRNLIALLFLPVLALSVEAAVRVAGQSPAPFLWLETLSGYDPYFILPLAFGGLLTAYVHWSMATTRRHALICWAVVAPLLIAAGCLLPAAANLYVIASAILLLLQRAIVTGAWRKPFAPIAALNRFLDAARLHHAGTIPLTAPQRLSGAGNKAYRLSQLKAAGLPVPPGVVLTEDFLTGFEINSPRRQRRQLARVANYLAVARFAVRSSAAGEDGAAASFAGVFESELDVTRDALVSAVGRVLASFKAERASSYGGQSGGRNILIQPMIDAAWAGVLFTEDPQAPGMMLVEAVEGTGEKLVSGKAQPRSMRFGRTTLRPAEAAAPPFDVTPLLKLARDCETRFGAAQDIEWAYARGKFTLLQSRDITTAQGISGHTASHAEWRRLAGLVENGPADGAVLVQNEMSEMLPRPAALSLSLIEAISAPGGGVDHALRALGLAMRAGEGPARLYVTAFGRLYTDTRQAAARAPALNRLALRRIRQQADKIEIAFRQQFVPEFSKDMLLLEAVDLSRLSFADVSGLMRDVSRRFISETHADVEGINITAQIYLDDARRALEAAGRDPVDFLSELPRTAAAAALDAAFAAPPEIRASLIRAAIGHRARCDYDLAEPRYGDSAVALNAAAGVLALSNKAQRRATGTGVMANLDGDLSAKVSRACAFQTLKEDAKHLALRELAQIRRLAIVLGQRCGLGELVFHLTLEEVFALAPAHAADALDTAARRGAIYDSLIAAPALATRLTREDLERGPLPRQAARVAGALAGTRVAGNGIVEGRAVVISHADCEAGLPIPGFADGDILVAPMIHPGWLPEVVRAGGIVTEIGGWLSHMSIVAREHGIVKIVGVSGLSSIAPGSDLRLHPDGRVERLPPRRFAVEALAAE